MYFNSRTLKNCCFPISSRLSRSPLKAQDQLMPKAPKQSRNSWHLHDCTTRLQKNEANARIKPKIPPKPRSCSADSSSKKSVRISCDVTNLSTTTSSTCSSSSTAVVAAGPPSLQVIGTKSRLSRNNEDGNRSQHTSYGSRPLIKRSGSCKKPNQINNSSAQDPHKKSRKMVRSRQILKELQRQVLKRWTYFLPLIKYVKS